MDINMEILIASIIIIAFCIFGMCFNIIFKKGGEFPNSEISQNKEMRKRGIICAKEEEIKIWGKKNKNNKPFDCSCCNSPCK
ncbi:MAG: hypothetical protein WCQ46_00075 [Bacteroidales bacterium]|jgi:hypothetical protein